MRILKFVMYCLPLFIMWLLDVELIPGLLIVIICFLFLNGQTLNDIDCELSRLSHNTRFRKSGRLPKT